MPKSKVRKKPKPLKNRPELATDDDLPSDEAPTREKVFTAEQERELLAAGLKLSTALSDYEAAVRKYTNSEHSYLDLNEGMEEILSQTYEFDNDLLELNEAIEIIEFDEPISSKSARGVAWRPFLSPHWLLYCNRLATNEDAGYIAQLAQRLERERAKQDVRCGRETLKGTPCAAIPIFWPGRGRSSACSRHLTATEKTELRKIWLEIESNRSCPGCSAVPGDPCNEDGHRLIPVDGEWPRIRGFDGIRMHDARLDLESTASSAS